MVVKVYCSLQTWNNLVIRTIKKADNTHQIMVNANCDTVEIKQNGKSTQFMWAYA